MRERTKTYVTETCLVAARRSLGAFGNAERCPFNACFSRAVDFALRSRFLTAMSKTLVRNAHTAHCADVHNASLTLFDKNLSKKSFCRFHKDTMQGALCEHLAYTKCYASYACFSCAVNSALRSRFLTAMSKTAVRNAHTAHRADVHNASLTLFTKNLWQRNAVS